MKTLSSQIKRELETQTAGIGHCAIYEKDLERLWPLNDNIVKEKSRSLRESLDSV
jgi:hypothetical protein